MVEYPILLSVVLTTFTGGEINVPVTSYEDYEECNRNGVAVLESGLPEAIAFEKTYKSVHAKCTDLRITHPLKKLKGYNMFLE